MDLKEIGFENKEFDCFGSGYGLLEKEYLRVGINRGRAVIRNKKYRD